MGVRSALALALSLILGWKVQFYFLSCSVVLVQSLRVLSREIPSS